MRNSYASGVLVSFLIMGAGCGAEPGVGDEELPTAVDEPASAETAEALTPRATPTCNTSGIDFGPDGSVIIEIPVFSSSSGETSNCNMVRGTHSVAVLQLQESLNACYGKGLAEDSDFGGLTQTALRQVQAAEHITADGQYGPQTRDHMCHKYINGTECRRVNEFGPSQCPRR